MRLLAPQRSAEGEKELVRQGQEYVRRAFDSRFQKLLFAFFGLGGLAIVWVLVLLVGLPMLPGWAKEMDGLLLFLGVCFFFYSVFRYGLPAARLNQSRVDAIQAFKRAEFVQSPLVERLAKALRLRQTLPAQERGKSPDGELLDTKSYRKLISDGLTTQAELCALGRNIASALELDVPERDEHRFSNLAREAGLDTETALFYRDLAAAAREISLESEWA